MAGVKVTPAPKPILHKFSVGRFIIAPLVAVEGAMVFIFGAVVVYSTAVPGGPLQTEVNPEGAPGISTPISILGCWNITISTGSLSHELVAPITCVAQTE